MTKISITDDMNKEAESANTEQPSLARRRLLKLGAYVPPAIVGMAIISSMPTSSHAAVGSCMPSACKPCIDDDDTDKDGNKHGDKNKHKQNMFKCEVEKSRKKRDDERKSNKHN